MQNFKQRTIALVAILTLTLGTAQVLLTNNIANAIQQVVPGGAAITKKKITLGKNKKTGAQKNGNGAISKEAKGISSEANGKGKAGTTSKSKAKPATTPMPNEKIDKEVKKAEKALKKVEKEVKKEAAKGATTIVLPKLIDYLDNKVPQPLVDAYKGTTLKNTVQDVTSSLNKMVLEGNMSNTQVEGVLRDVFSTALTDTNNFASELLTKHSLQNIAITILQNPKDLDALRKAAEDEIKAYAEQELNKLANQAIGALFPIMQGIQFDFTKMNKDTFKATLRSAIINALAQSYLGPGYAVAYMAVATICPPCMEKMHAELRRFDKKYLQPGTEKIGEEWNRFADRVSEESSRVGKQIAAEYERLKKRVSAEAQRQKEDVEAEAKRAEKQIKEQFEKAKNSKIGKEVEREFNDVIAAHNELTKKAVAEFNREAQDALEEGKRISIRMGKELEREVKQHLDIVKKAGSLAEKELKKEAKQLTNEAQRLKDKVQAELKRIEDKAKAEANRLKKKVKKAKKKLRL